MTFRHKRQRSRGLKSPNGYSIREALDDGRSEEKSRLVIGKRLDTGIGNNYAANGDPE
jgi:hypothetical protein